MLETVRAIVDERWKRQPNGFIISTRRIYVQIKKSRPFTTRAYGGIESDYSKIAQALEALGGKFYDFRSRHGLSNRTGSVYGGSSTWQFTEAKN